MARLSGMWRGCWLTGLDVTPTGCFGTSPLEATSPWTLWGWVRALFGSAGYGLQPCPLVPRALVCLTAAPGDTAQQVCADLRGRLQRLGVY